MAQQLASRASMAPAARMGSPSTSASRLASSSRVAPFRATAFAPRHFTTAAGRKSLKVQAVLEVSEDNFEAEVLKADLPVLVDFWATWCGPCKLVAPSMEWAEKTFPDSLKVVKVDCTDGNKSLMEKYKVYGLPCLIVFKNGEEAAGTHREGAITRKDLVKYLEQHVGVTAPAV